MFSQAPFIEESIQHLAIEGLLGLVFAIIVILIFLLSVRSTLVTAISIPLSVLVTFIGLNLGGYSLNMLTLGALTIAIGRVVDDSIVVIENIKRHLGYGEAKQHAILAGVREVAGAITVLDPHDGGRVPADRARRRPGRRAVRAVRAHRHDRDALIAARLAHDRAGARRTGS